MLASRWFPLSIQRRLYAGLQILGGGQLVMVWMNQIDSAPNTLTVILLTVLAAVGLASAMMALMYLDGSRRPRQGCLYFWAIQVPNLATPWVSYRFFSGAELRVGLFLSKIGLFQDFRLGDAVLARVTQDGPVAYIGINALALAAVVFFVRERAKERAIRSKGRPRLRSSPLRPHLSEISVRGQAFSRDICSARPS